MNRIYVAIGSNIEKERNLPAGVEFLAQRANLIAVSAIYETDPIDDQRVEPYFNAAALVETDLEAYNFKYLTLRSIELTLNRVRTAEKNTPRTIDLDIVLVNSEVCLVDGHPIPEPEILTRAHIVIPLAEIAPTYIHPEIDTSIGEIASRFQNIPGITRLAEPNLQGFLSEGEASASSNISLSRVPRG